MNEAIKQAMALALPDAMPDPRDTMFRSGREQATSTVSGPNDAIEQAALPSESHEEEQAKMQSKQQKVDALRPLA